MKQLFQVLIIAVFLGVFAAPSFAAVVVDNVDNIATVDDEPKKKEEGESNKSAEGEETKKKSECKHSKEEKASCKKEKSSCSKK
jgi:hypothetical protein